jgi:hypothetical protein
MSPVQNPDADRSYSWKRIEPLSERDRSIDLSDLQPLAESWTSFKQRLNSTNPAALQRFNERLIRSLSIETGILERIYLTGVYALRGFCYTPLVGRVAGNAGAGRGGAGVEPSVL